MAGLTPKLPLYSDAGDGFYGLIKEPIDVIKQNLKNLILTVPGERMMDPNFGVGLYGLLFEQTSENLEAEISSRLGEQIQTYMPFIGITNLEFFNIENPTSSNFNPNSIRIKVEYEIIPLGETDMLEM